MLLNFEHCERLRNLDYRDYAMARYVVSLSGDVEIIHGPCDGTVYERIGIPENTPLLAPTYEQFFEWCRTVHRIDSWISPELNKGVYSYYISQKAKPFVIIRSVNLGDYDLVREQLINKLFDMIEIENEILKDIDL